MIINARTDYNSYKFYEKDFLRDSQHSLNQLNTASKGSLKQIHQTTNNTIITEAQKGASQISR